MQGRPVVVSVSAGHAHGPYKPVRAKIELVEGLGVDGDAHAGSTVQHRSRARAHPHWINLRQVHLLGVELHEELAVRGLPVEPGKMSSPRGSTSSACRSGRRSASAHVPSSS